MPKDYDDLFARTAVQVRILTAEQAEKLRAAHARLESSGQSQPLALLAIESGTISPEHAQRVIDAINRKYPGKHPTSAETPPAVKPPGAPPRPRAAARPGAPVKAPAAPSEEHRPSLPPPAENSIPEKGDHPLRASGHQLLGGGTKSRAARPSTAEPKGRPPVRPPRRPSTSKVMLFGVLLGGAGVLAIVIVALLATGGKSKGGPPSAPPPKVPVAAAPRETAPPKTPDPPPPPRKPEVGLPAPTPPPPPERKPEAKPAPPPPPDEEAQFRTRMAQKRQKALERLEETRREIAQERKAADEQEEALRKRLSGKTFTLALKNGQSYKDAAIRKFSLHDADLEVGGRSTRLTWDAVVPASALAAANVIFDPSNARDQFERGRFLIARRLWKDAQEAFERAAKIGDGYESRVVEFRDVLERLVSGQGAFKGAARRVGKEGLLLTYDFQDSIQLADFTGGLVHSGRSAILETKPKRAAVLKGGSGHEADQPVVFVDEISVEMKASTDVPITFHLFEGAQTDGWEIDVGPQGLTLFRVDPAAPEKDRRKEIARTDKGKLAPGKTHELGLRVRFRKFTVTVDRQEALSFEDPPASPDATPPHGYFGFSIQGGKLKIDAPLIIQGRVHAEELEKRMGEVEVFVRRALDPELEEIRERRERAMALQMLATGEELKLSADDRYFLFRMKDPKDFPDKYESLKRSLAKFFSGHISEEFSAPKLLADLAELITKYPDVPSLFYLRALLEAERQNATVAREDVRKALELFPEFAEALTLDARTRLAEFDLDGALKSANRAIDAAPDFSEAYVQRAMATFTRSPAALESFMEDLAVAQRLDSRSHEASSYLRILRYQSRGPRDLGCRFDSDTPHYAVTTDISAEASKRYGENLEAAWRHYSETFKNVPMVRPLRKPRVAIFNTAENYYTYFELLSETRGEHTLGVFRSGLNELVLFETLDQEETQHTLYHEAFHHFMNLIAAEHPPYWYNEGMAEYMGAIRVKDGKVEKKAMILSGRLRVIQWVIEVNSTLPFAKIMVETPREFYGQNAGIKYAQSWSMIHFFYESQGGKYRPLMERYLETLRARKSPQEAYDAVFAPQAAALESEWKDFVKKLKP